MQFKYLPGLNSLRFFAAFFVVISHANISLHKLGIYTLSNLAFLNRGGDAVDFFFSLSGFLITYLLIGEIHKTRTVSIRQFYLRRVFRIWPLYFLIVAIGFFLLGYVYPKMYHQPFFGFTIPEGLLMFILFVPNYAAKNFTVGLLNPLWSIGVEEQFYLFWAPMVKIFRNYLKAMIVFFLFVSTGFYVLIYNQFIKVPNNWEMFLLTQKFYAMAIGAAFGYLLYHHFDWYNKSFLATKPVQIVVLAIIVGHYIIGFPFSEMLAFKILLAVLYSLLILNVSAVTNKLINIEVPSLSYLGVISYGIYMYHMLVDYVLRMLVPRLQGLQIPSVIIIIAYYLLLLTGAIIVAGISYKYFEKYFLQIKDRLHAQTKIVAV